MSGVDSNSDEETIDYKEVQRKLAAEKLKLAQNSTDNLRGKGKKKKKGGKDWRKRTEGKTRKTPPKFTSSRKARPQVDSDSDGEDTNDFHAVMSKKRGLTLVYSSKQGMNGKGRTGPVPLLFPLSKVRFGKTRPVPTLLPLSKFKFGGNLGRNLMVPLSGGKFWNSTKSNKSHELLLPLSGTRFWGAMKDGTQQIRQRQTNYSGMREGVYQISERQTNHGRPSRLNNIFVSLRPSTIREIPFHEQKFLNAMRGQRIDEVEQYYYALIKKNKIVNIPDALTAWLVLGRVSLYQMNVPMVIEWAIERVLNSPEDYKTGIKTIKKYLPITCKPGWKLTNYGITQIIDTTLKCFTRVFMSKGLSLATNFTLLMNLQGVSLRRRILNEALRKKVSKDIMWMLVNAIHSNEQRFREDWVNTIYRYIESVGAPSIRNLMATKFPRAIRTDN